MWLEGRTGHELDCSENSQLSTQEGSRTASAGAKSAINRLSVDYRRRVKRYLAIIWLATRRGSDGKPGHRVLLCRDRRRNANRTDENTNFVVVANFGRTFDEDLFLNLLRYMITFGCVDRVVMLLQYGEK